MVPAVIAVVAAGSLLVPAAPIFDAWSWLGWGDQLKSGGLNTSGPTAWKPLAGLIGLALTPLGSRAPTGWLLLVRVGGLCVVALTAILAARLALRPRLAAAAAVVVVLGLRHAVPAAMEGGSEVLIAALLLAAALAYVRVDDGRPAAASTGVSAALAGPLLLAGLLRPEAWPLAAAAVVLAIRTRGAAPRALGVLAVLAMVGAWWLPTGAASAAGQARGSPLAGSTGPVSVLLDGLTVAPVVAGILAVVAVTSALRQESRVAAPVVLGLAAASWMAVVLVEAGIGYPALARFVLPLGPIVAALAGVGLSRLSAQPLMFVAALVLLGVEVAGPRLADARTEVARVRARAEESNALTAVMRRAAVGPGTRQLCVDEPYRSQVAFLVGAPAGEICSGPGFAARAPDPDREIVVISTGESIDTAGRTREDGSTKFGPWAVQRHGPVSSLVP